MPADPPIPDATLEAFARSFFRQGRAYGFGFADYVRFVNVLLDVAMRSATVNVPEAVDAQLPLRGQAITVRSVEADDRPRVLQWLSEPEGQAFLRSRSTRRHRQIDVLIDDPATDLGLITLPEGRPVGLIAYLDRDPKQHKAELRKWIAAPSDRGRGFGGEATRLWLAYGRGSLGLEKIYLYTLASNGPNLRLNQHLGFRVEGVLRDEVFFDGSHHDVLRMALVAPG